MLDAIESELLEYGVYVATLREDNQKVIRMIREKLPLLATEEMELHKAISLQSDLENEELVETYKVELDKVRILKNKLVKIHKKNPTNGQKLLGKTKKWWSFGLQVADKLNGYVENKFSAKMKDLREAGAL
jgi:hypothetical protein